MTSLRRKSKLWICLFLTVCVLRPVLAGAVLSDRDSLRVGRENPFASFEAVPEPEPPVEPVIEPVEEDPDLVMGTIVLKFLHATSVRSVLERMVTPYGAVAVNESNNSVVICDTPGNLEKMLAEIKKVDRTPQQIAVEVVILDVQLKDDTEIGINWDLMSHDTYDIVYRQGLSGSRLRSTIEDADTIGDATAFNTVGLGGDLAIISGTVRHVLHALQQKRNVEILASPRVLVVSGQSANIKAVEEIPYEEVVDTAAGGAAALTSTQFKEVGVNLEVTATVTDGNNIFLTVVTEQNVATGVSERGVPVVDTRRANTSLLLDDGQLVIIGGLRRQEKTEEVSQVPILGDLPLIGALFRSTTTTTNSSELVVLLSPRRDRGEPVPADIAAQYQATREMSLLSERRAHEMNAESASPEERRQR